MNDPYAPPFRLDGPGLVRVVDGTVDGAMGRGPFAVTTDSRLADEGRIFVPLRGERHDGHDFVLAALAGGACGALVAEDHPVAGAPLPAGRFRVLVADPLAALWALARHARRGAEVPVIGLTGSVGKTTTRAMIEAVLRRSATGLATEGNLNNHVGVPLTLLRLRPDHRWMVIEMGMSAPGEIEGLAGVAEPTVRLITVVAPAHLERLGTVEAVADAKGELFATARPGDVLVANADDPLTARFPRPTGTRMLRFGEDPSADVRIVRAELRGVRGSRIWLSLSGRELRCDLRLPGRHNVSNAAAAAAACWAAGASPADIAAGLAAVEPVGRRMTVHQMDGVEVLDDAYNANPRSVDAALQTLVSGGVAGRTAAALGDMLELGSAGPTLHAEVGKRAAELGVHRVVATGELTRHLIDGARAAGMPPGRADWFADTDAIVAALAGWLEPGDRLLVKGSRGMRMERVIEGLKEALRC